MQVRPVNLVCGIQMSTRSSLDVAMHSKVEDACIGTLRYRFAVSVPARSEYFSLLTPHSGLQATLCSGEVVGEVRGGEVVGVGEVRGGEVAGVGEEERRSGELTSQHVMTKSLCQVYDKSKSKIHSKAFE